MQELHELQQTWHQIARQFAFDVQQPALEATVGGQMAEGVDGARDGVVVVQDGAQGASAVRRFGDDGAENAAAVTMGGLQPAERWYGDELVAEVAEVIDAGPVVEAVVVPFDGAVDEAARGVKELFD